MGSALLNQILRDETATEAHAPLEGSSESLRLQVAERLAAHRNRRRGAQADAAGAGPLSQAAPAAEGSHKSRIAATVAERYAQAQSYRAFLAAEAERALQQARAAAEIAARNARAVAAAREQLLETLAREEMVHTAAARPEHAAAGGDYTAGTDAMLWPELEAPHTAAAPDSALQSREPEAPGPARTNPKSRAQRGNDGGGSGSTPAPDVQTSQDALQLYGTAQQGGAMRVVLYEELPSSTRPQPAGAPPGSAGRRQANRDRPARHSPEDAEALALDEEISFRQAPVFEEPAGPPMALPANLLEFPRQLVASRKARPRYAEGPLREEDRTTPERGQLRIFEVDTAQISTTPDSAHPVEAAMAQWTSLWLDTPSGAGSPASAAHAAGSLAHPMAVPDELPYVAAAVRPQTALLSRRALSAAIDAGVIGASALAFGASFAAITGHIANPEAGWSVQALLAGAAGAVQGLPLTSGLVAASASIGLLAIAYQLLFFTFSESTPGMRLTRIAFCTFADGNPTRRAMRLRMLALVLSTVTLGLGHLWALLDEDGLTWQDLISRMYPRSY